MSGFVKDEHFPYTRAMEGANPGPFPASYRGTAGPTAILFVTSRCNQRCVFCLESDQMAAFTEPDGAQCRALMESLFARGARNLTFMGAETLMRPDVPELLAFARTQGYRRLGIATNGTLLARPGALDALVDAGLNFIEFSLHGADPATVAAITGRTWSLPRQLEALAHLDALGRPAVLFNIVACRENAGELAAIARLVAGRFPRIPATFRFKFASLAGRAAGIERPLRLDEVDTPGIGAEVEALGLDYLFEGFPLCRLGPHAHRCVEVADLLQEETYFNLDGPTGEYQFTGRSMGDRLFPATPCAGCAAEGACAGVQDRYFGRFGTGELRAIPDTPLDLARRLADAMGVGPDALGVAARTLAAMPARRRQARLPPAESGATDGADGSPQEVGREVATAGLLSVGDELAPGWTVARLMVEPPAGLAVHVTDGRGGAIEFHAWVAADGDGPSWFTQGGVSFAYRPTAVLMDVVTVIGRALAARLQGRLTAGV